jgi:TolA-binding protein
MRSLAIIFSVFALFASGCHRKPPQTPQTPVAKLEPVSVTLPITLETGPLPPPQPAAAPTPAPLPPVVSPLAEANRIFNSGNYPEAIKAYESYLQWQPTGDYRDEALFHLSIAFAMPSTSTDQGKSITVLKQLIEQYPDSPYRTYATVILALQSELLQLNADAQKRERLLKQLSTEIDKFKQIDADRRRRP